jgi:hypothetical protein
MSVHFFSQKYQNLDPFEELWSYSFDVSPGVCPSALSSVPPFSGALVPISPV